MICGDKAIGNVGEVDVAHTKTLSAAAEPVNRPLYKKTSIERRQSWFGNKDAEPNYVGIEPEDLPY
jgi:hypothetical protein